MTEEKIALTPSNKIQIVPYTLLLAVLWVVALWGFWERGVYAFGINATLFLLCFLFTLRRICPHTDLLKPQQLAWSAPIIAVISSYSLYENPFLKICGMFFIPASCALLIARNTQTDPDLLFSRSLQFLIVILRAWLAPIMGTVQALWQHVPYLVGYSRYAHFLTQPLARSIARGLIMFVMLAFFMIIPLLSSIDQAFKDSFETFYHTLSDGLSFLFDQDYLLRIISIPLISAALLAMISIWTLPISLPVERRTRDSVAAGILLAGIAGIYLLFIWIQLERLWVGTLPLNFYETERYVKSGFWQLVLLSALNILLVNLYFGQTIARVQYILISFVVSSLLLLCSAAHRMYLYVTLYGFSNEKLYASYTVLYCLIVFSVILYAFFKRQQCNILKTVTGLLIWMYAGLSLFPCEYFICRANARLSQRPESRINLADLTMLSIDALPYMRSHHAQLHPDSSSTASRQARRWIQRQEVRLKQRPWYEFNLSCLWSAWSAELSSLSLKSF